MTLSGYLKCFFRGAGVLLPHLRTLADERGIAGFYVPSPLVGVNPAVVLELDLVEILVVLVTDVHASAIHAVGVMLPPGCKVQPIVLDGEFQAFRGVLLGCLHHVKELTFPAFCGGFDHHDAIVRY